MHGAYSYAIHPRLEDFPNDRESLLKANPHITDAACGAFVFISDSNATTPSEPQSPNGHPAAGPRVLILQRASNLPESLCPNTWDFPGGHYETTDACLFDAVAREVLEETGLHVSEIVQHAGTQLWSKGPENGSRKWGKFCFIVKVTEAEGISDTTSIKITCAPKEHDRHAWATLDELKEFNFIGTNGTRVIKEAFKKLQELEDLEGEPQ